MRVIVYDRSDISARLGRMVDLEKIPEPYRPVDVDIPVGLSHSWAAGGRLYRLLRRVDAYRGFGVWYKALEWLLTMDKITEIQYWGHGSPGNVWMNGEALTKDVFTGPLAGLMTDLREKLAPGAVIWFRTCGTFCGQPGHQFASAWVRAMGCKIVGHTHVINFWHGGLHSLAPGQIAHWPMEEGVAKGSPLAPEKMAVSTCKTVNMVTCLHSRFPETW